MNVSAFLYNLVEGGRRGVWMGRWFDRLTILCIAVGVVVQIVVSVPVAQSGDLLVLSLAISLFFVVEYCLRQVACVHAPQALGLNPTYARLRYAISPFGVIDVAPLFVLILTLGEDSFSVIQLNVLYLLKLPRYFEGPNLVATVIRNERKSLSFLGVYALILLMGSSTIVHISERATQPAVFGSLPATMWWSITTISTVGYGDVVPVTLIGRLTTGVTMVCAVGLIGFIFGAIGLGLAEELRRRNFIVTWIMVSKVPSFSRLSALQIAQISALLEPIAVRRGDAVVTRGEASDSLYFIVRGDLRTAGDEGRMLSDGDHFGDEALAPNTRRSASVIAQTDCQLLRMRVDGLRKLMARTGNLAEAIRSGGTNTDVSA
jgi:voltage-gated potassium channel